jgi:hypothetical protein
LGVGRGANNSSPQKRILLRNVHQKASDLADTLVQSKQRKRDMNLCVMMDWIVIANMVGSVKELHTLEHHRRC